MLKKTTLALAAATTLLLTGCDDGGNESPAGGITAYVTDGAKLYTFSPNSALSITEVDFSGLNAGSLIYALDMNPRGSVLTAFGSDGQSYTVNADTGALTAKGTRDSNNTFDNKHVEMDYNPTVPSQQVFRVVTSTGENFRHNDTTGDVTTNDTSFAYKTGDVNAGKSVVVSGIAYTDSQPNSGVPARTAVFAIDSQNDTLALLGANPANGAACPNTTNPNCGQLTTIGALGINVDGFVGFDIASTGASGAAATANTAYATAFKDGSYSLYTVNLTSGAMTFLTGLNPKIQPVRAFAVKQQ